MDSSTFDTLARAIAQSGTRRRLVALLAMLPLGGLLTDLAQDEVVAERPTDRVHGRTQQRNQNQRNNNNKNNNNKNNNKGKNKKNNNSGGGGGNRSTPPPPPLGSPSPCAANGGACRQGSQCCSGNCFNFVCADMVTQCTAAGPVISCTPPDAGGTGCCASDFDCCFGPENQCDQFGVCCAPDCAGKQCGPDGCGRGGTCGTCSQCETCDEMSGQCSPVANGTPCNDGNPLCVNGRCCTAGHEVVHGGCFQINNINCQGCNPGCGGCAGSIDGSPNFLCVSDTSNSCKSNADCPVGQACQGEVRISCVQPC
jgi:hypothetical protein